KVGDRATDSIDRIRDGELDSLAHLAEKAADPDGHRVQATHQSNPRFLYNLELFAQVGANLPASKRRSDRPERRVHSPQLRRGDSYLGTERRKHALVCGCCGSSGSLSDGDGANGDNIGRSDLSPSG